MLVGSSLSLSLSLTVSLTLNYQLAAKQNVDFHWPKVGWMESRSTLIMKLPHSRAKTGHNAAKPHGAKAIELYSFHMSVEPRIHFKGAYWVIATVLLAHPWVSLSHGTTKGLLG